jgi:hypothetical protein
MTTYHLGRVRPRLVVRASLNAVIRSYHLTILGRILPKTPPLRTGLRVPNNDNRKGDVALFLKDDSGSFISRALVTTRLQVQVQQIREVRVLIMECRSKNHCNSVTAVKKLRWYLNYTSENDQMKHVDIV